tara:strand:+ start:290 stop:418 length:129 start_codon:yes stop_codon:yes gene_type:complete
LIFDYKKNEPKLNFLGYVDIIERIIHRKPFPICSNEMFYRLK